MILRDPVHGLVSFERPTDQIVVKLLACREVQRLRRVKMLGVASLAFPGGDHSRFAHSLGAAHVMRCFLGRMQTLTSDMSPQERLLPDEESVALAAALLHDLGHGPLSHLFEDVFAHGVRHEKWTSAIILDPASDVHGVLREIDPALPTAVERLVHGQHTRSYLAHAVSGTFDVDRCDYLLRDSYMTGVRYGLYDLDWLLRSLRLYTVDHKLKLAVDGSKGLPAVEGFFLARLFMYQQVYHHKAARAAERMIRALFRRVVELITSGRADTLTGIHPVLVAMAQQKPVEPHQYCSLDDGAVWTLIELSEHSTDHILADLAVRLRKRDLFKTVVLDDEAYEHRENLMLGLSEIVKKAGFDPVYYTALDTAEVIPFDPQKEPDAALDVVYRNGPPKSLGKASFLLSRLQGSPLVRHRLVFPKEVREQVEDMLRSVL